MIVRALPMPGGQWGMAGRHNIWERGGLAMHYRTLGQTGLQVSEVGLGAMPFGGMVTQGDGTQFGWTGNRRSRAHRPRARQ